MWESGIVTSSVLSCRPVPVVLPPAHLHVPGGPGSAPAAWKVPWVLFTACPLCSHSSSLFSLCCLSFWETPQQARLRRSDHWVEAPVGAQVEALQGTSCVPPVPCAQDRAGRRAGGRGKWWQQGEHHVRVK